MIYKLRKKFILISAATVGAVFAVIFGLIYFTTSAQLDRTMDMMTDMISSNDGVFPDTGGRDMPPAPMGVERNSFFDPEASFSTRFFYGLCG